MPIIIRGPQGCGKTSNAQALAAYFGCTEVVDDWDGFTPLCDGALALTNSANAGNAIKDAEILEYGRACWMAGIRVS